MEVQLISKVKSALSKALDGVELGAISPQTRLKEDIGLDSMTSLIFLINLEENIEGFYVDPETLDSKDLYCVESIIHYVEYQLGRQ